MFDIPYHFVQKISVQLGEKTEELCSLYLEDDLNNVIKEAAEEYFSGKSLTEVRRSIFKNQFQKTKKRWYHSLNSSLNSPKKKETELLREIAHYNYHVRTYGQGHAIKSFGVDSVEMFIENRLSTIKEWVDDSNSLLTSYPYIHEKSKTSIINALKTDIALTIADVLLKENNGKTKNLLTIIPNVFSEHAFYGEKTKLDISSGLTEIDGKNYLTSEYSPDENYSLLTIIDEQALREREITDRHLKALDNADFDIFQAVMNHSSVEFVGQRKIFVQIGEIVKEVYKSDGKKNYEMVLSRLIKMANIRFTHVDKERVMVFGIFDYIEYDPTAINQTVEITVSEVVHRDFTEFNLIQMYSDAIARLEIGLAKLLIFPLQKERLRTHAEGLTHTVLSYEFFSHKLRFKNRGKLGNIKIIENCLDEMIRHNITVKSYRRVSNRFHIEFLEVTEHEIHDLLPNSKNNPQLISLNKN